MRSWRTGSCRLQEFSRLSVSGLVGTLYPLDGNWNFACFDCSGDLCDFPILQNTITGLKGLIQVYRGWNCLWDDQVGASQEVWNSTCYARHYVRDSDSGCLDYRYGDLGCLDWCRGLVLYPLGIDRNNTSLILIGHFLLQCWLLPLTSTKSDGKKQNWERFSLVLPWWPYCSVCLIVQPFGSKKRERKLGDCWEIGTEPEILANMYKLLIEENNSMIATVTNFGKTSFLRSSEKRILTSYLKLPVRWLKFASAITQGRSWTDQVYQVARDGIAKQDQLAISNLCLTKIPMLWLFREKLLREMVWRPSLTGKR